MFDEQNVHRDSDGRFGEKLGGPPEVFLTTADGRRTAVTPGVLDSDAQEAFMEGQCVAFAVAVAEATEGGNVVMAVHVEDNRVIHAWASVAGSYTVQDAYGHMDDDAAFDQYVINEKDMFSNASYTDDEVRFETMSPTEARERMLSATGESSPRQDYELAATFVTAAKEMA